MTTRRRSKRSPATAGSTKRSAISAASVPGRGEKMNVKASSKRASAATSKRRREVVVGLTRKPDDDVGRHGEVGNDPAGFGEAVEVARAARVTTVHRGQHTVGAGLQRIVQLLADRRRTGHRDERLGAHVLGMRRREADATDALDGADGFEEVGEQRAQRSAGVTGAAGGELQVASVAVDVLAEQRHLGDAVGGEHFDLGDDVAERAAHLLTAHGGDDAERTRVVAADLDRDPGVVRRRPAGRQRRGKHRVVVDDGRLEDLGDRSGAAGLVEQLGGAVDVVGPHHDVDVPGPACARRRGPSGRDSRTRRSAGRRAAPSTS